MNEAQTDVPTFVPDGETPAATCPYCDRPFRSQHARDLHVGEAHDAECSDEERQAFETARDEESDELFLYHIKVVVALGLTYSATILLYMMALGSGII